MTMRLEDLSLVDAAAAIRKGEISPSDYAQALLGRMDELEPRIRAWVTVDRAAVLAEARACESEARRNVFRGPLHGIPVGVKDIYYTKGLPTKMGSPLFEGFVPTADAHAVKRLKQAGAIVLGKTVTTEFAYIDPGVTRNPWNIGHTPGGSSSGSAAAVAARMCPASIGTQTVGSIGRPAGYNGIVALVPTQQRIRRDRVFPVAWTLDHMGAFARSVADVALMFEAMTETPVDHPSVPSPIRVGLLRGFFYDNAGEETRSTLDALADRLSDAGFRVNEVRLPEIFSVGPSILRVILRAEIASAHESIYRSQPEAYSQKVRTLVETGMVLDSMTYLRALRLRRQYQAAMLKLFENCDVLMTPAARGTAPEGLSSTGDSIMNLPWALADFPTLNLPYTLGANGLPLGIQLSAPSIQEGLLLDIGRVVETAIAFNARPQVR